MQREHEQVNTQNEDAKANVERSEWMTVDLYAMESKTTVSEAVVVLGAKKGQTNV